MEIKFNNVNYIHNNHSNLKKVSLKNINLNISSKKITCIIGNSGSGKTTLIELINGLLLPTVGQVQVGDFILDNGKKIYNINKLRVNIGLVFQNPEEQFFKDTIKDEIAFGMKYFKYKTNRIDKQVKDALTLMELDSDYLKKNPFKLSSGEARKVAIASILAFNPKIIILDEPTVGLDYKNKRNLIKILKKLNEKYDKTIIIVSHDIDMVYEVADDVIVLNEGKVLLNGNKEDVFKNINVFQRHNIALPNMILFYHKVKMKKNIELEKSTTINDLIKVVYRDVC